jgi:hypothetical protein
MDGSFQIAWRCLAGKRESGPVPIVVKLQVTNGPPGAYGIVGASGEDDCVANFNSSLCCRNASGSFHLTTGLPMLYLS